MVATKIGPKEQKAREQREQRLAAVTKAERLKVKAKGIGKFQQIKVSRRGK